ncbi:MAG: hypothetical protein AAGI14_00930 [Pseudomonadota bacterium]
MRISFIALGVAVLSACQTPVSPVDQVSIDESETSLADAWFEDLSSLCGQGAFAGTLVSTDEVDADFRDAKLTVGPAVCSEDQIRLPLAVGDDRSRTWVISKLADGYQLKHDHRHKDGTEDALTQYGGMAYGVGRADWQQFPVDEETRALFTREQIEVSNLNTWGMQIQPGAMFAYQMWRPERNFRIEFDLTEAVDAPPPPWGVEPVE